MTESLIVNLFAGPGSGKSTMASGLFYTFKNHGKNAELAGEYAKDLVWSRRQHTLQDQIYVFGKQHHRIFRLIEDVDLIIADSPILLGLAYAQDYPQCFRDTVNWAFNQYNNINFYIERVKPYNPKGRNQDLDGARAKDDEIKALLKEYNTPYISVPGNDVGLNLIVSEVLKKMDTVEKTC
jgi:hypothetical protein